MIKELENNRYPYMMLKNKVLPYAIKSTLHSEILLHEDEMSVNTLMSLKPDE